MIKYFAAGLLILGLTGCSAAGVDALPSASPSTEVTDVIPADPTAEFKKIAAASCDKAFAEGVVETRDDYGLLVMIPKDQAYEGFSAVYKDVTNGRLELIYEADSFYACAAALMWALAEESGEAVDGLTVEYSAGKYLIAETFEDSTFKYEYEVADGLIVGGSVSSTEEPEATLFTQKYGDVGAENFDLIKQAVAELNASE